MASTFFDPITGYATDHVMNETLLAAVSRGDPVSQAERDDLQSIGMMPEVGIPSSEDSAEPTDDQPGLQVIGEDQRSSAMDPPPILQATSSGNHTPGVPLGELVHRHDHRAKGHTHRHSIYSNGYLDMAK
ncbi:hypothetical protein EVJ50_01415 [Synechococcus sp. RSCCF101]|uniref:hypothetical protein n=1 Tax=Synechococcus sp. RSCCF101 TaxID=2511069 RepID=UPI0012473638|nr:hypothetical protein [Synechococcus sp. RSCCF101]QEY31110.1 hypothetical protein EVJ50_01415 [Synechococcus sp. RSCCF101]